MRAKQILGAALLLALGVASSVQAQPAPRNRSLTIPVWFAAPAAATSPSPTNPASAPDPLAPAATPASPPALECTVSCGAAIPLSGVAFSPDGKTLAVGGYKEVVVWDLVEGKLAKRIGAGKIGAMVQAVVFSKDGKTLAVAEGIPCGAGAVRIFDLANGQLATSFQEPKGVVYCLAVSPDLPRGLAASDAVIPAGQQETQLTVTASADAAPGLCFPTVVGTATVDGRPLVRKAVPVETVVQAFYIKHWVPTKGCVLEVKEPAFLSL